MSSGSYPGPFHGDVQMPLNEGTKDRHALRGPQRELSYSKHAPAPWPGERSHTQENSKLRKSQRWSHTPTKGTPWLINTTAQLCPDAGAHGSLRSPFCRRDPRSRAGGHRAEMRSQAPAQPRACPLPTVTRGDSSSTGRTNHSPKFQTKELNTETALLLGHVLLQPQARALRAARTTHSCACTVPGPALKFKGTTWGHRRPLCAGPG